MFFFGKKKLLEMDEKLNAIMEYLESEKKTVSNLNDRILDIKKCQNELFSIISNDSMKVDKQLEMVMDKLDRTTQETKNECKNIYAKLSTLLENNNCEVIDKITVLKEEMQESVNEDTASINKALDQKYESIIQIILGNIEKVKEQNIRIFDDKVELICNNEKNMLQEIIENNNGVIEELAHLEKREIIDSGGEHKSELQSMIDRNNNNLMENIELINEQIKLLLLNTVMDQL